MKAIHIDPTTKTVREIEIPDPATGEHLSAIYAVLGCRAFDLVRLEGGDAVFVDDEGLLKDDPGPFFGLWGYPNPLAGHGLVLGADDDGNSCAPTVTVAEIEDWIVWLPTVYHAVAYSQRFEQA